MNTPNENKKRFQSGQAISGIVIATALLTSMGNWMLSRALNSPDNLAASIVKAEKDIVALQGSDKSQSESIKEMKDSIEYIRRVVEEQARRQGIVIKQQ